MYVMWSGQRASCGVRMHVAAATAPPPAVHVLDVLPAPAVSVLDATDGAQTLPDDSFDLILDKGTVMRPGCAFGAALSRLASSLPLTIVLCHPLRCCGRVRRSLDGLAVVRRR